MRGWLDISAWWYLTIATAVVAWTQLWLLNRRRRALVDDAAVPGVVVPQSRAALLLPTAAPQTPAAAAPRPPADSSPSQRFRGQLPLAADGIVYVDATGRCTLADPAARDILHWSSGERCLSDLLAGGTGESAALLHQLTHEGSVNPYVTALKHPALADVEVSGMALRDRDDNLWGAALFIHRPSSAAPALRSAPSLP